jgi:hypothetical protein
VVLNPEVEAEAERLRDRLEALNEALGALRSIDGTESMVAGVDVLIKATAADLAALPALEIVWAQGPNPPFGMRWNAMMYGSLVT